MSLKPQVEQGVWVFAEIKNRIVSCVAIIPENGGVIFSTFACIKNIENKNTLNEDIKKVLLITDNLLEKLPEDVINDFIKSKDFELYERVINKIK